MDDATTDIRADRLKRVQEKNKRAQARYRQKQKEKMQTFEEQCVRLTEDLKAMSVAYGRLEREKAVVEIELRDLRLAAGGDGAGPSSAAAAAASSGLQQPEQAEGLAQPQPIRPHRPVPQASGPVGWDRCPGSEHNFWNTFVRAIVSKQLGEDQAKEADQHPFEWKDANEIFAIYKGLIEELNARLALADRDHTIDAHKAVSEVIHAMRTMGRAYEEGLTKQQRVEGGMRLKEEIDRSHGTPRADIWHSVLNAARVSPGQRDRILDLRASHLQRMEEIIRQRKDIVWELQQATVMPETASKRQVAYAKTLSQAVQLATQLQDSLAAEHLTKEEFFRRVCHQVLNELQEARMLVTAFPHLVDIAAVCDLLATEPDAVTSDSDGGEEPMRRPGLPAILQIPAVVDSDLTPDLYINAFAWGCDKATRNAQAAQQQQQQQQQAQQQQQQHQQPPPQLQLQQQHLQLLQQQQQQQQQGFRPPAGLFTSGRASSGFAPPAFFERPPR